MEGRLTSLPAAIDGAGGGMTAKAREDNGAGVGAMERDSGAAPRGSGMMERGAGLGFAGESDA